MIRFEDVSFHYGGEHGTGEGVDHVSLHICEGEMVVFIGPSGCGKTTLTRLINGLAPHFFEGELEGAVWINEHCVSTSPLSKTSPLVGSVFQNPKSQFFNLDTTGELVFGCENQGLPREEIKRRLKGTERDLRLSSLLGRNIFELSGGEKQQIACGGAYTARPPIYVFDEPSSNLDQKAIWRLKEMLKKIRSQKSTVVISEHRLHYLMDLADRFVYLEDGRVIKSYTPAELLELSEEELRALGLRCTRTEPLREERASVRGLGAGETINTAVEPNPQAEAGVLEEGEEKKELSFAGPPGVEALDLTCVRGGEQILAVENLSLPKHGIIAMIGDNGSGKSTLTESLCGVIPSQGSIAIDGIFRTDKERARRSFLVMQDVNRQLFADSVLEEVRLNSPVSEEKALEILKELGLSGLENRHPSSLSGGQKQRVAIACALCAGKDLLFFDEPTSGLDRAGMERFGEQLKKLQEQVTSVIITHDPELIDHACTHVLQVENGRILGFYPLNQEGRERMRWYFLSDQDSEPLKEGGKEMGPVPRPLREGVAGAEPYEKEIVAPKKKKGTLERILTYAGPWKRDLYGAIALMVIGALASVGGYLGLFMVIRSLIGGERLSLYACLPAVLTVLCSGVVYAFTYSFGLSLSHRCAYHTLENLRLSLQEKLEEQPPMRVGELGVGAVKKLFTEDIEGIEVLLAHVIPEGLANLSVPVAVLLALLAVDWQIALVTVLMLLFGLEASKQMVKIGMDRMGSYFASAKRLNNTILSLVSGMEVIRVFNRQGESGKRFEQAVCGYRDFALSWYRVCWPWTALYGSLFSYVTLYSLPFGALMVSLNLLSLERFLLALCLSFSIGGLLMRTLSLWGAIPQVNFKLQALEKALDYPPLRCGREGEHLGEESKGEAQKGEAQKGEAQKGEKQSAMERGSEVVFDRVRFSYQGREVIKGVSFCCREGEMTALVGASGSGKTTLAKLLVHYMDPSHGEIRIGGKGICDMTLEELSCQVAYVSQNLYLFQDSIRENIRIGKRGASDEEVYEAARRAGCEEFISSLPQGYDTPAGVAGNQLSGGQKQRIAFARVLLKDAPIVVLDEAAAFLDAENEKKMNEAIANILEGKTVLVIAHRLSSIVNADHVVLLKDGKILAEGDHQKLMASSEEYRRLWALTREREAFTLKGGQGR